MNGKRVHRALALFTVALFATSCAAATDQNAGTATDTPLITTSATPTFPDPELVGEWERFQECQEIVDALTDAGLQGAVLETIAGDGWIPGVSAPEQIADPTQPCTGAVGRMHSHFFTADGEFGSRDANGQQVDDGRYEVVDDGTLVIIAGPLSTVTFHYTITNHDTIAFEPVIPDCAPDCFEASWSVAVAYPGYTWTRVV